MCVIHLLQSQSFSEYQPFGITESRLDFRIIDHSISIPNCYIMRRNPQLPGQTGISVSACASVCPAGPLHTDAKTWKMTKWNVFG